MSKEDEERLEFILKQTEQGNPVQLTKSDHKLLEQLEALIKLNQANFGWNDE